MDPSNYTLALLLEINKDTSFVVVAPDEKSLAYALRQFSGVGAKVDRDAVQRVEIVRKTDEPKILRSKFTKSAPVPAVKRSKP